jgi:tricorn protease-like protein
MNTKILATILFGSLLGASYALAAEGKVTISNPMDGATVSSKEKVTLQYQAMAGSPGEHLHLNVDGKRVDVIHQLEGKATVDPLPPGKHHVCLALNTSGHVPTGVEQCIDVTSK